MKLQFFISALILSLTTSAYASTENARIIERQVICMNRFEPMVEHYITYEVTLTSENTKCESKPRSEYDLSFECLLTLPKNLQEAYRSGMKNAHSSYSESIRRQATKDSRDRIDVTPLDVNSDGNPTRKGHGFYKVVVERKDTHNQEMDTSEVQEILLRITGSTKKNMDWPVKIALPNKIPKTNFTLVKVESGPCPLDK